jgi:hypothetical protein
MTADLPEWAIKQAIVVAKAYNRDWENGVDIIATALVSAVKAERERAAKVAKALANSFTNSRDMMVACQEAAADAKALEIAAAILADDGGRDG